MGVDKHTEVRDNGKKSGGSQFFHLCVGPADSAPARPTASKASRATLSHIQILCDSVVVLVLPAEVSY